MYAIRSYYEGIWDISEKAKKSYNGTINKDDLIFKLMIRQPDFVENDFALQILEHTKNRITSYNVCYTKLLRNCFILRRHTCIVYPTTVPAGSSVPLLYC